MKSWPLVLFLALSAGCAALQKAGERAVEVGGGTLVGTLLWFLGPAGVVGGALAALGGAVTALLLGGGDTVHEAPSNGWDLGIGVGVLVVGVLLLRSWAHWLPPLLEILKQTAKGTPRALLGGRPKKPAPRFKRRTD